MQLARLVQGSSGEGQDRVEVFFREDAAVLLVADGSGGTSGGAEAAERALRKISKAAHENKLDERGSWLAMLGDADDERSRASGQCAIVAAAVIGDRVIGASVGDCEAWLIADGSIEELTATQVRKPLLGSGQAVAVAFEALLSDATLLLATDGLVKYARRDRIAAVARGPDLQAAARALVDLPRLRSGTLPDDVAVVLYRG